jgi:predicted thioredoxin/glutaredoxin
MKVELFYTPGCAACAARHEELRTTARQLVADLEWRDLNVLDNIDRAVELGVLTVPALAIDGELVFTSLPTIAQLRRELNSRTGKEG